MQSNTHYTSLNQQQYEAIFHQGNIMCVAGAGSGKTKTLTTRIFRLLNDMVPPTSIMGITFTNKAAKEMKERIISMHPAAHEITMTTFHSFAARFLRPYAERINRTPDYTIYNDTDQKNLLKRIMKNDAFQTLNGSAGLTPHHMLATITRIKSSCFDTTINIDNIQPSLNKAEIYTIQHYENFLLQYNALDFNDLIRYCVNIMHQDPTTIPKLQHLLIDEFQDTDPVQFELVNILSKYACLSAFSDMDQSIYEWRNAISEHVIQFIDKFNAKVIKLEDNYRSTPTIVQAANQLIQHNNNRLDKVMRTTKQNNQPIVVNNLLDADHEAASTADTIKHLIEKFPETNVGILYRQNRYSRKIETALRRMHIPYHLHKGVNFIQRREIALTLHLFRFVTNPKDIESAKAVLSHLGKGFGDVAMRHVENAFKVATPYQILAGKVPFEKRPALQKKYQEIMQLITPLGIIMLEDVPQFLHDYDIYQKLCTFSGDEDKQYQDRQQNLNELMLWIHDYAKTNKQANLSNFIQESSLDASEINDMDDTNVHLMTVHAAKGLEFDFVFIIGCVQGFFPGKCENEREIEEARRLFYVAITRAKEMLYLCVPEYTYLTEEENKPTSYLHEINQQLMHFIHPKKKPQSPQNLKVANI